jgi:tetratricopeptide (TPR) repeat protein
VYYWGTRDYGRALQEFSAALVARPNDGEVHAALANVARRQGSWEQSVASRARAIDIDPGSALELSEGALTLHALRRFDEAEALYERSIAIPGDYIYPSFFVPGLALARDGSVDRQRQRLDFLASHIEDVAERTFHDPGIALPVWRASGPHQAALLASRPSPGASPEARAQRYIAVGQVQAVMGNREAAAAAYDTVRAIVTDLLARRPDDDGFHAQLSLAYAGLGRCDEAIREAERAVALLPVSADALSGPQRVQSLAEVETTCGRADSAIDHLTYLLGIPSFVTPALLRADPVFAPLHGNPRFERLTAGR